MSCESCTGCFEATPCSAPAPSINGHISKEYRQFLKAARVCAALSTTNSGTTIDSDKELSRKGENLDHAFNSLISILASNQFTAQTYLAQSYRQLGSGHFLQLSRTLAHHGFWGRLITWAFLFVGEDSPKLQSLLDQHDEMLLQNVNDEAEMFEVFNPAVSCQRVAWSKDPLPTLSLV
ncbi:hypothetical protein BGZ79_004298 [Entomortierella chlamydospora]|nr:hypothetical protein BGZ79_004298 [Entomortierella chlamydospora]